MNTKRRPCSSDERNVPRSFIEFLMSGKSPSVDREFWISRWYFNDTPYAEDLWHDLKPVIMRDFIKAHPGRRPWAWWQWDAPEPRREGEAEDDYLARHGLLTESEKRAMALRDD